MAQIELCIIRSQLDAALEEGASLTVLLEQSRREQLNSDIVAILESRIDALDRKARSLYALAETYRARAA